MKGILIISGRRRNALSSKGLISKIQVKFDESRGRFRGDVQGDIYCVKTFVALIPLFICS